MLLSFVSPGNDTSLRCTAVAPHLENGSSDRMLINTRYDLSDTFIDDLGQPAAAGRHERNAAAQCFKCHKTEGLLVAGYDDRPVGCIHALELCLSSEAEEAHLFAYTMFFGNRFQVFCVPIWAFADDKQPSIFLPTADDRERLEQLLDAFDRHEPSHIEKMMRRSVSAPSGHTDTVLDNNRFLSGKRIKSGQLPSLGAAGDDDPVRDAQQLDLLPECSSYFPSWSDLGGHE